MKNYYMKEKKMYAHDKEMSSIIRTLRKHSIDYAITEELEGTGELVTSIVINPLTWDEETIWSRLEWV